ncbi:hypothetical protein JW916_11970 [Candidatus Sumerlaeota bacterium]|nr:hypothetical protein [Candidatus Sumerlaeota bacterium]
MGRHASDPRAAEAIQVRSPRTGTRWTWPFRYWVLGFALFVWTLAIAWLLLAPESWALGHTPWLRPAGHCIPLLGPYLGLIAGGDWNWLVSDGLLRDILIGAIGLAFIWFVGRMFLSCFEIYVPRMVEAALALPLGIGLCGVVYTFVALLGLLYQWFALLVLVFTFLIVLRYRHRALFGARKDSTGPTKSWAERRAEKRVAIETEEKSWIRPEGFLDECLAGAMTLAIAVLTLLTFYHAVLFPETYWDSLILYLGYARKIFLEHGFPVKVVAQVGIGLGANYPHLYELTGATIAAWANHWSPVYLQLAAPLAGLATILLVYHTVLRLSRNVLLALAVTLLVRSLPYLLSYHIYASSYAFAVFYCAAFFYCALRYVEDGLPGYLILSALCAAFGVHVNYLMWALWPCWLLMVVATHLPRRLDFSVDSNFWTGPVGAGKMDAPQTCTQPPNWPVGKPDKPYTLWRAIWSRPFAQALLWGGAISSIWYVRNWIVTGNPVYAFFSEIFGGRHINPDVLASAMTEWMRHGDGIGVLDRVNPDRSPIENRLLYSWFFFANLFKTAYKFGPTFLSLVVPGVLLFLLAALRQMLVPRYLLQYGRRRIAVEDSTRFGLVAFFFLAVMFVYHYTIGPFYLYHLLTTCAVFGVFVYFALRPLPPLLIRVFCAWSIFCFLMPGLPWALMGSKLISDENRRRLLALHNPGLSPYDFYCLRFGHEPAMWEYANARCRGAAILTHENRHLVFDPSIALVHMDDWEVQEVWGKSNEARLRRLYELGVRYYLRVPYEFDHPVNARLGHAQWLDDGTLTPVCQVADQVLYRFRFPWAVDGQAPSTRSRGSTSPEEP